MFGIVISLLDNSKQNSAGLQEVRQVCSIDLVFMQKRPKMKFILQNEKQIFKI